MWYNCTFPKNETINDRCCPQGNVSIASTADLSSCFVGFGNATDFNECMQVRNVTGQKCYLQDMPSESTVEATIPPNAPKSGALRGKPVGWIALGLLLLTFVNGVHAQTDETPVCKKFIPDAQDSWRLDAEMPYLVLSARIPGGGMVVMEPKDYRFRTLWAADVPVVGDFTELSKQLPQDREFKESFKIPHIPDKFGIPRQQRIGTLAASTNAAVIPGTYTDCSDGKEHKGNVTVPERKGLYYFAHQIDMSSYATSPTKSI